MNLVTVVPILGDSGQIDYYVGLQVDLVEQPNSILEKMKGTHQLLIKKVNFLTKYGFCDIDGTYLINYHQPMSSISSSNSQGKAKFVSIVTAAITNSQSVSHSRKTTHRQ